MNFEDLNYPLFETTKEEKEQLSRIRNILSERNFFLCNILWDDISTRHSPLRQKIKDAIGDTNTHEESIILRKIWIDKLLAYEGE